MSKIFLIITGALVLAINAATLIHPAPELNLCAGLVSVVLGLMVIFLAATSQTPKQVVVEKTPAPTPPPAPPRPEAEIVAFLALLQEHGRLVDFTQENIAGATDQQVGVAARVVHAGCKKILQEYFEIQPLHNAQEGDKIVLEKGYDATAHRLLGSVPQEPPYHGKLVHPGWLATKVQLPRVTNITEKRPWPVVAPAEIELGTT
jgi:hypothetical protein